MDRVICPYCDHEYKGRTGMWLDGWTRVECPSCRARYRVKPVAHDVKYVTEVLRVEER